MDGAAILASGQVTGSMTDELEKIGIVARAMMV